MAHLFLFILLTVTLATSEEQEISCGNKDIGGSTCRCEYLHPESVVYPDTKTEYEIKLSCIGNDSLKVAHKYMSSHKNLILSKLVASNGTFDMIHDSNLQHFTKLKNLSLSNNLISSISSRAFRNQNHSLVLLDLSQNKLTVLSNSWFETLGSLKNLSLSFNQIHSIESEVFNDIPNILYLDLSHNQLTSVNSSAFTAMKKLEYLLLNNNKIAVINDNFNPMHLQHLDLSFNKLKSIQSSTFGRLWNLIFLSLAENELTTFDVGIFEGKSLKTLILRGNMWVCNRKLLPLNEWLRNLASDKESVFCSEPPELRNLPIQQGLDYLHLVVKMEESPTCNKTMCNCSASKEKLVTTVDCSNRGLTRLPEVVPYKTKVLNLHNNNIKALTIDHIDATLWSDVSFLYLNNNVIDSLKGLENTWLLRNLVALHLSNNKLAEIAPHILEQFKGAKLDELFLSENPWNCDCNTVRFQTWLQDSYRSVRNLDGICCSADSGIYASHPIYKLKKSQLCPQQVQWVNYLDILNGLMAAAILFIIAKLSYDYYLQKRTGKLPRFFSLNL